jgi:uncharacterized membrane protein YgdD (TMEM256/DUF423 family)
MNKQIVLTGIVLILLAIILGAFGTHVLYNHLSQERFVSFETGVKYQIYQGLGLLIIGLNYDKIKFKSNTFFYLYLTGTVFFSFSIYFLVLANFFQLSKTLFIPLTPIGGVLIICSWILLFIHILTSNLKK